MIDSRFCFVLIALDGLSRLLSSIDSAGLCFRVLFSLAYGRWGSLIDLRGRLHCCRSHDGSLSFADCDVSCLFVHDGSLSFVACDVSCLLL